MRTEISPKVVETQKVSAMFLTSWKNYHSRLRKNIEKRNGRRHGAAFFVVYGRLEIVDQNFCKIFLRESDHFGEIANW